MNPNDELNKFRQLASSTNQFRQLASSAEEVIDSTNEDRKIAYQHRQEHHEAQKSAGEIRVLSNDGVTGWLGPKREGPEADEHYRRVRMDLEEEWAALRTKARLQNEAHRAGERRSQHLDRWEDRLRSKDVWKRIEYGCHGAGVLLLLKFVIEFFYGRGRR